jgi:hypothetical protein
MLTYRIKLKTRWASIYRGTVLHCTKFNQRMDRIYFCIFQIVAILIDLLILNSLLPTQFTLALK